MKFAVSFLVSAILVVAAPLTKRDVDPALVPQFGHQAGLNPTGTGDCDGITNAAGQVVKIPCFCPPNRPDFLRVSYRQILPSTNCDLPRFCSYQSLNANVAAGRAVNNPGIAVSFPTGNDKASKLARMNAAIVTLQNLRGPGAGCPAASTTFVAQRKDIQDGTDEPAPQSPAPGSDPASQSPSSGVDLSLVPEFGHQAGLNPTGTGDCDGITNPAGQVIKVPCFCPPNRDAFIKVCPVLNIVFILL